MSTLAAMSPPCSFDQQGKTEASKGVSRRPRFVIKPNIRPGKAPSAAPKPKPATPTTNAAATAGAQSCVALTKDDLPQLSLDASADEHDSGKEVLEKKAQEADTVTGGVVTGQELRMTPSTTDENNGPKIIHVDDSLQKEDCVPDLPDKDDRVSLADKDDGVYPMSVRNTDSNKIIPSSDKTKVQQMKSGKLQGTSSSVGFKEPVEEVIGKSDVPDFPDAITETDTSCMSEAMSLEPDEERTADVDIDLKKAKRRRIKKPRAEPLPSREKSPDRQKMKMSDLLSWNPHQNFLPKKIKKKPSTADEIQSAAPTPKIDEDKESSNQSASLPAPQIMIGPDGNVVLNTESLLIDTAQEESKLKEVIEEDDDDRYLNTNSYRKHKKTKFWTEDETERFYLGLSMCGTDFSLLTNLMKGRSRRELKNKFQREEKRNRRLVDKALANRQPYDPEPIEKMAAEEEEKAQKQAKKKIKNTNPVDKKEKKPPRKKPAKKRKKEESEDEEDDWGPEYDEENDDNVDENDETSRIPVIKRRKKAELLTSDQQSKAVRPEQRSTNSLPPKQVQVAHEPEAPRVMGTPGKNIMQSVEQIVNSQRGAPNNHGTHAGPSFHTNTLNAIPGSSRVQIEMEGVQSPVQGIIIPSSMVPQIAPQLGIPGNPVGIQILLVQEESASGNLVHVYVIPEADKNNASGSSAPGGLPALSSPIPSPHPTTPLQSPLPSAQFPPYNTRHPAPICSPQPYNPIQSPPLPRSRNPSGSFPNLISPRFRQAQGLNPQHSAAPVPPPHNVSTTMRHGLIPASIPQDHVTLPGSVQFSSEPSIHYPNVARVRNAHCHSGPPPSQSHLTAMTAQVPPQYHSNLSTRAPCGGGATLPAPTAANDTVRTGPPAGQSSYSPLPATQTNADYTTSVLKPVIERRVDVAATQTNADYTTSVLKPVIEQRVDVAAQDCDYMMGTSERPGTPMDQSVLTNL